MKISLVIPNYNGLENLRKLIPQVLKEDFEQIFVLDDASTDDSVGFIKKFPQIQLRRVKKNLGPTATRNMILKEKVGDIIVFLDADMQLINKSIAPVIKTLFQKYSKTAVFGAMIISAETNEPMWFNYGYDAHLVRDAKANVWHTIALDFWHDDKVMKYVREKSKNITVNLEKPHDREVDWVSEGIFMVRSSIFKSMGGFDEKFVMYYEGPDFCKRIRNKGYSVRFTTKVQLKHLGIDSVGSQKRARYKFESLQYYYQKHYGVSESIFNKLFS